MRRAQHGEAGGGALAVHQLKLDLSNVIIPKVPKGIVLVIIQTTK